MNDMGSREITPLDAMNSWGLRMIWTILGREPMALTAMNMSGLLMNDSKLWAQGFRCYENLKDVDDMNDSESSAYSSRCYEQLKVMDDMNDSVSWAQGSKC